MSKKPSDKAVVQCSFGNCILYGAKLEPRFCLIFIYRRSAVMRIEIRNVGGLRRVKRIINVVGTLGCPNSLFYFVNKEATMTNIQYSLFVSLLPLADHICHFLFRHHFCSHLKQSSSISCHVTRSYNTWYNTSTPHFSTCWDGIRCNFCPGLARP